MYTLIAVPEELVGAVTRFIESAGRQAASPDADTDRPLIDHWTAKEIRQRYANAKEGIQRLMDFLAAHPEEAFGMGQLEQELGLSYDKLNGLLGGFSKVNKREFGNTVFPWRVDSVDGRVTHGMPEEVAEVVRGAGGRS